MPFGPPPVLPELVKQFEEYLTKPEKLPLHNNENDFRFWNREIDLNSLYDSNLSPALTTLRVRFSIFILYYPFVFELSFKSFYSR